MDKHARREAIRDFKEKKTVAGIYAVRCAPSGDVWVAGAPNVEPQHQRHWFGLRTGGHHNRTMQAAWNAHGGEAFSFEVLERLDDEALTGHSGVWSGDAAIDSTSVKAHRSAAGAKGGPSSRA